MSRRECRLAFFCSRLPSLLLLLLLSPSDVVGIDTALWCELTSPEVASERLPLASFLEDRLSKENEGIVLVLPPMRRDSQLHCDRSSGARRAGQLGSTETALGLGLINPRGCQLPSAVCGLPPTSRTDMKLPALRQNGKDHQHDGAGLKRFGPKQDKKK